MSGPWIFAYVVMLMVVTLMGILLVGTLRRISPLLEQAEAKLRLIPSELAPAGLPTGTAVPHFEAPSLDGSTFHTSDLRGIPSTVLFVDADCEPCHQLVDDLKEFSLDNLGTRLVVVVDNLFDGEALKAVRNVTVLHQIDREVARVFQSSVTPHAFVLDMTGTVVETGHPNSLVDLTKLAQKSQRGGGGQGKNESKVSAK